MFLGCMKLPEKLSEILTTNSTFPVEEGAEVWVECLEYGYTNTGDSLLTCNTLLFEDFSYNTPPHCVLSKSNLDKRTSEVI